jgi:hypothetical protein
MAVLPVSSRRHRVEALKKTCAQIATAEPGNTRAMAGHLNEMILAYYGDVLSQANQSFWTAVGTGALGVIFFFWAVYKSMGSTPSLSSAAVGVIGGAIVQTISGIQFFIYNRASRQFASFHICLERMNRFLLADTICDNLQNETAKQGARLELIHLIATAPMLVLDDAGAATPSAPIAQKAPALPAATAAPTAA